ncbi:MAG: triphosphoribosyl-dephospho-CoA synthase [Promethearchaeia archaeon]
MPENLKIVLSSLDDILRCVSLASLLEISGYPKPGNVHRTMDFNDTRFEHLLAGVTAIQPNFRKLCERTKKCINKGEISYDAIRLGKFFKSAGAVMMKWQKGGNVLLGHLLILAPLTAATVLCIETNKKSIEKLEIYLHDIISSTTTKDTIDLYEAMHICKPGGLGKVKKYDITDEAAIKQIQKDNATLKDVFEISQSYDLISREYMTNFQIILHTGLPYFLRQFRRTGDINQAVVNTFLKILGKFPDSLIVRKSGKEAANSVSKEAQSILKQGGITSEEGLKMAFKLDKKLQKEKGNLNPGTTADLVAGIIYCGLITGIKW